MSIHPVALANMVVLLEGWPRFALAFAAGGAGALALAPVDFLPALLLAFVPLVWLLDGVAHGESRFARANLVAAAGIGWWFGFGYFLAGFWWLGAAFIIGGEQFVWLLPLGVLVLPAGLALFPALGLALVRLLWSGGITRIFALAFGLGFAEWLRATVLTGFPWNGFGQALAGHITLAQGVSVLGTEALGPILILVFAAFAALGTGRSAAARLGPPLVSLAVIVCAYGFGAWRLGAAGGSQIDFAKMETVAGVRLRIMQPNIAQSEKLAPDAGVDILERYFALSDRATGPKMSGVADVTHLFWPEAPFPFILNREPRALERIARYLAGGTVLVTGSIRAEPASDPERRYRYFNAIEVLDRDGLQGNYDKVHLVPFGEYLPFESVLRRLGLKEFVRTIGGFSPSRERRPLVIAGLPSAVPMICFETIFPRELDAAAAGPGVLVNVTNDAWFGQTAGPYQHLAQARLRAIEFGKPMIRAANSGISAVIDPFGRFVATLPLATEGVVDAPLPVALRTTLYRNLISYSYGAVMICILVISLAGVLGVVRRASSSKFGM